jgi:L1 cell adhesion molecule like protein
MVETKYENRVIGIDLGTSNSCVAVWTNEKPEVIPNEDGENTTPSCVAFKDDQRLLGRPALKEQLRNESRTVSFIKRIIGRDFSDEVVQEDLKILPYKVETNAKDQCLVSIPNYLGENKKFSPEEISSVVLQKLKV